MEIFYGYIINSLKSILTVSLRETRQWVFLHTYYMMRYIHLV